jgi:hypothetical protein
MVLVLDTDHVDDGYEPRCSVCNCEYQADIEAMRENNKTFEEIRHFMDIKGIKISLMAFSRHFSRHYPQRKLFLEHLECKEVKIDREVGLKISEILEMHPYMDINYFQKSSTFSHRNIDGLLESFEKCNQEIFVEDYGFCNTCQQLCPIIPAKEATYADELAITYQDKDYKKHTAIKLQCLECKLNHQDTLISHLLGIMSRILLDLESYKNTD